MPITIRGTTAARIGRITAQLGAAVSSQRGTVTAPASRNGRLVSNLGVVATSLRGQFAVPAARDGKMPIALGVALSSLRGTFSPAIQAPVWSGPPDKQFIFGVAENWDISQYDSKGATDLITKVAGTLVTGLSYDQTNKRIIYNGTGPIAGSNGHQLMADDIAPSTLVSISSPQVTEGDTGQNVTLRFVLSRSTDGRPPISYSAATTSAGTATPSVDFTPFSQSGTISAGQSINLDVVVIGDVISEGDETVDMQVTLAWA